MIVDKIIEIIIDMFVSVISLLGIPDTPSVLLHIEDLYTHILELYVMPIMNFLFGRFMASWLATNIGILVNLYISYKLTVWIYDKVRGGKSE